MKNIPQNNNSVKEKLDKNPQDLPHLSRAAWHFYDLLSGVRNLYRRENKLQPNGSFFKENDFFVKRVGICRKWVQVLKKELKEKGLIDYTVRPGRGNATSYWILDKPPQGLNSEASAEQPLAPFDPAAARVFALSFDPKLALSHYKTMGYSEAEILKALEG